MLLNTKTCSSCKTEKVLAEFYKRTERGKLKLTCACKDCCNKATKRWRKNNSKRVKAVATNGNLLKAFGITTEQKQQLVEKQNNCCYLCKQQLKTTKNTHVDHIDTDEGIIIRSILCSNCNTALGKFNEDHNLIRKASDYVEHFVYQDYSI